MPKKYYQDRKDRKDESKGEKKYLAKDRKDRKDESKGMEKYLAKERKDRKDESKGMEKYLAKESYAGYDMRRRQEYEDSMMIKEDHSAIANLPQDVKYVLYPKEDYYNNPHLDDTLRGADRQMRDDVMSKSLKRNADPEKY